MPAKRHYYDGIGRSLLHFDLVIGFRSLRPKHRDRALHVYRRLRRRCSRRRGLIPGPDGSFYGLAAAGEANGLDVVYQLSPPAEAGEPWMETVLYSFKGGSDGYQPYSALVHDRAGNLYGVTYNCGGIFDYGVVYEVSPSAGGWTENRIYTFQGPSICDGFAPSGTLAIGANGELFGTTVYGGAGDYGTVYQLTPSRSGTWTEKVLYSFTGGADGGEPFAGGQRDGSGPESPHGRLRLRRRATETTLYAFQDGSDGAYPQAGVVLKGGKLYGTTNQGGSTQAGVVFEIQ